MFSEPVLYFECEWWLLWLLLTLFISLCCSSLLYGWVSRYWRRKATQSRWQFPLITSFSFIPSLITISSSCSASATYCSSMSFLLWTPLQAGTSGLQYIIQLRNYVLNICDISQQSLRWCDGNTSDSNDYLMKCFTCLESPVAVNSWPGVCFTPVHQDFSLN